MPPRIIGRGKRPTPEFPTYGFLGALPNLGGGSSTEWSVTIPHPSIFGAWTNVPTLFPGQQATHTIPGDQLTPEQWQQTMDFAQLLAGTGYELPAFKTVDEAVFQAGHRHKGLEAAPDPWAQGLVDLLGILGR